MKTILLATMSLGIGGAETHILELALELKHRGVDVHVASNGGVYVSTLEKSGIPHHVVPMHRRSVTSMLKSLLLMRKILKRLKPDIVHAHARIPGFICGLLNKTMRFAFVTTAHFDFEVGHGLRYLTNWGAKTIAVSEDIKEYLINNYGLASDDIFVTVNAVDTVRFHKDASPARVAEEFGLDLCAPVISYVSRLDANAALAASTLIEIAPALNERLGGVQILIAGDGDIYDELAGKAAAVNAATGAKTVIMTGSRTDVEEIIAAGNLFVGVSRSALEALSAEKPVILAGNEGYLGLFTPDKAEPAKQTNFTCRGCEPLTREALLEGISSFFLSTPQDDKRSYAAFGRELILSDYSVTQMADDCIRAYEAATGRKYSIVMSGYYGFKNAGDEAILQSVHRNIAVSRKDISITVLSADPGDTKALYGYDAVNRFNVIRLSKALRRCDVLISGGGSLLQDVTSTRSLMYYLYVIRKAKRMGRKVMVYSNGIGPINKEKNRRRVRRIVSGVDVITLRDSASAEELRQIGVLRDDVVVTADPVFTMPKATAEESADILRKHGIPQRPFIAVSVRDWPGMGDFCRTVASLCDSISGTTGRETVFISMQTDVDSAISRKVRSMMSSPSYIVDERLTAHDLMGIIGAADAVLAMRLHALIFAARMGVPFAGLVYDPKVSAYLDALSMPSAGEVTQLDMDSALRVMSMLLENRDELAGSLAEKVAALETAALEDPRILLELLET